MYPSLGARSPILKRLGLLVDVICDSANLTDSVLKRRIGDMSQVKPSYLIRVDSEDLQCMKVTSLIKLTGL